MTREQGGARMKVPDAVERVRVWLGRPNPDLRAASPTLGRLGVLWVCVSVPFTTAVSAFVHTPAGYLVIEVVMAFGAYTVPALFAARVAIRGALPEDRPSYEFLNGSLVCTVAAGVIILGGLATGWSWVLSAFVPAMGLAGLCVIVGLAMLVRRRSGRRALSVDVIEAAASVLAVTAPLVLLWWPAVLRAEVRWYAWGCAIFLVEIVTSAYWVALMWARLGPGPRGIFEGSAVMVGLVGSLTAAVQVAQGVSGFALPAPPLIGLCALSACAFLLIPLHVPLVVRQRLNRLPPQAQVRGAWIPTAVPLAGLAALFAANLAVGDERSWAVPFSFVVVALLAVLGGLRQIASLHETRQLYHQVEVSADERGRLLKELLERSVSDRHRVVQQLHEQAVAAYVSFATLARTDRPPKVVAKASEIVSVDMERNIASLRELVLSMRQPVTDVENGSLLEAPIRAHLATAYRDRPAPRLTVTVADGLLLDWVAETVLFQIVHEALDNVSAHSDAHTVEIEIAVELAAVTAVVRITDDGNGFDPATTPEGAGFATMRASVAVLDGRLTVESRPGAGTEVVAHFGPGALQPAPQHEPCAGSVLRLLPDPPDRAG